MPDELCDLKELSRVAMRKAQGKAKELRQAGLPVPAGIFGQLVREGYREAREECAPVAIALTPAQEQVVAKVCSPCQAHYLALKKKLLERKAAKPAAVAEAEAETKS